MLCATGGFKAEIAFLNRLGRIARRRGVLHSRSVPRDCPPAGLPRLACGADEGQRQSYDGRGRTPCRTNRKVLSRTLRRSVPTPPEEQRTMSDWPTLMRRPSNLPACAEEWFTQIAERLMNGSVLMVGNEPHRFVEVEFYYKGEGHPDPFTHGDALQLETGRWYFHRTAGVYRGGSFKGLDLTFGSGGAYGGVLIRGSRRPTAALSMAPHCASITCWRRHTSAPWPSWTTPLAAGWPGTATTYCSSTGFGREQAAAAFGARRPVAEEGQGGERHAALYRQALPLSERAAANGQGQDVPGPGPARRRQDGRRDLPAHRLSGRCRLDATSPTTRPAGRRATSSPTSAST